MSRVVGTHVLRKVPIRRLSSGCFSDNEDDVSRLKTLLKKKARTSDSTIPKRTKAVQHDNLVDLKDGTTLKLCKSCTTKKNNLTEASMKSKDKPKTTRKVKDNTNEINNKRALRAKNITIAHDTPDTKKINSTENKVTKPKETKKTKKDVPETKTPITINKEKKNNVDNSKKPEAVKRVTNRLLLSPDTDIVKVNKKTTSQSATEKKTKSTNNKNKLIVKEPSMRKIEKKNPESDSNDLVNYDSETKKPKRNRTKKDDEVEKKPKRVLRAKANNTNEKSPGQLVKAIPKRNTPVPAKVKKTLTNKTKNIVKKHSEEVYTDTSLSSDDSGTRTVKRSAPKRGVVVKKVKTIVRKSIDTQTMKKKAPTRITSKTKTTKAPDKLKQVKNSVSENNNSFNNSFDNLKLPNNDNHSTFIEDKTENEKVNESTISQKKNSNVETINEPVDNIIIKEEPIDDGYMNTSKKYPSVLKNQYSLMNDSVTLSTSNLKKSLTKPDMHVTFRNRSIGFNETTNPVQSKSRRYERNIEARKKLKNDRKVAIALIEMSKHFAKLQTRSGGEYRVSTAFRRMIKTYSSSEESSSGSCHCDCSDSSSSSSLCKCYECQMRADCSSSWSESSKTSDEINYSEVSDSVFEDFPAKSLTNEKYVENTS